MEIKSLIINGIEFIPKPTGGGCGCLGSIGIGLLFLLMVFGGNDNDGEKEQAISNSAERKELKHNSQTTTKESISDSVVWEYEPDNLPKDDLLDEVISETNDCPQQEVDDSVEKHESELSTESLIWDTTQP